MYPSGFNPFSSLDFWPTLENGFLRGHFHFRAVDFLGSRTHLDAQGNP
jgi:hypothetical protein